MFTVEGANPREAEPETTDMIYQTDRSFEMNGKQYSTDRETLELLRVVVPQARATKDGSAVDAIMTLGEMSGRIVEVQ